MPPRRVGRSTPSTPKITRAVRDLAPRFEHRLFLSATPHNGHSNSFSALLEILDPQRFCRGVPVDKNLLNAVMVRRLKDDLRETRLGVFPLRRVVQLDIDGLPADAPELRLAALLDEYRQLREERLSGETRRKQAAAGLLITGLQQRLLSSIEAFARTLRVHRKTVQRHWEESQGDGREASCRRRSSSTCSPAPRAATTTGRRCRSGASGRGRSPDRRGDGRNHANRMTRGPAELFAREQQLLDQMTEVAEAARAEPDARVRMLLDWIRKNMCPNLGKPGAKWNDLRVIIFTEYDDTKRYLQQQLAGAIEGSDRAEQRIAIYHGPTPPDEREAIKRAFNADPKHHPVRILIATDAAREGLNLQAHCWNLFHFDVPWNPSRMEQRNGRIDRKLQEQPEVFCHYFVYKQRPEDRILKVLVEKTERIKKELGSLAQVIDARLAETLKSGIRRDRIDKLEKEIHDRRP